MQHISELIDQFIGNLSAGRPPFPAIPTGFPELDRYLCGGLLQSQIMTIGGYPNVGKQDMALQIAMNIALREERKVVYFSRHRHRKDSLRRLVALACKVPEHEMGHDSHFNRIERFAHTLGINPWISCPIRPGARQFFEMGGKSLYQLVRIVNCWWWMICNR